MSTGPRFLFIFLALLCASLAVAPTAAGQAIIHVDAAATGQANGITWEDAFTDLQAGLDSASAGDEVWVAAGTYVGTFTLKDGVALYGGFAGDETQLQGRDWTTNLTILDAAQAGSVIRCLPGTSTSSRIDGLVLQNGTGTILPVVPLGGGIYCKGSSPVIANNVITSNRAGGGGGIYCESGTPVIVNNRITRNVGQGPGGGIYCKSAPAQVTGNLITHNRASSAGGGIYCSRADAVIDDNVFLRNEAFSEGGAVFCTLSSPHLTRNNIVGNKALAGGALCCDSSTLLISENRMRGNFAQEGGAISSSSSMPLIVSNTFLGNSASFGAAVWVIDGTVNIVNCTFSSNNSSRDGGSIYLEFDANSMHSIANSIIAFNATGIRSFGSRPPNLQNNCVHDNFEFDFRGFVDPTGTQGNIDADPQFTDHGYGNIHLQPSSPCRDAGADSIVQPEWVDIDGEPRLESAHVDIGADESDGTTWPAGPAVILHVASDGNDAQDGLSWAQPKRSIQSAIDDVCLVGGDVRVKEGVYAEYLVLPPYVYACGGFAGTESSPAQRTRFAHETVLDGQSGGRVLAALAGTRVGRIDGFTIRNGSSADALGGAGISCYLASPTIAGNVIEYNRAHAGRGGGIYCNFSYSEIIENTLRRNYAAGMGGGIYCSNSSTVIANNLVSESDADYGGGGVYVTSSVTTLANNTITGNLVAPYTSDQGGGLHVHNSTALIANTVLAFNSSGLYASGSNLLTLRHNCVYGNTAFDFSGMTDPAGTDGNLNTDPMFILSPSPGADGVWGTLDDVPGDVRLQAGSPCVDSGNNADVIGETDVAGSPRIADGDDDGVIHVDMGAYENGPPPVPGDLDRDRDVDDNDYALFIASFGQCSAGSPPLPADLDLDGCVTHVDFQLWLLAYRAFVAAAGHAPSDIPGDLDGDLDVDKLDALVFLDCIAGPHYRVPEACVTSDQDHDQDVDLEDFAEFQAVFRAQPD